MTALLFAGQGSEHLGMGRELAACTGCQSTLVAAERVLDQPLARWMADGPEEILRSTEVAQPVLLTVGVAQGHHLLANGVEPAALIGHSLGQYTALVVAGALDFADAVRLVAARGRLMQIAVPRGAGAMVAVSGLDPDEIAMACKVGGKLGVVSVACFNAPGRVVLSGETRAVDAAADACTEAGGGVVALRVSAAFHSTLLSSMVPEFARLVAETPVKPARIPVVDNVTAQPLGDVDQIRRSLVDQVEAPVRFEEGLRTLARMSVTRVVACGPGNAGLKFASRTIPDVRRTSFDEIVAQEGQLRSSHVGPV